MKKNNAGYPTVGGLTLPSRLMKLYGVDTTGVKRRVIDKHFNDSSEYSDMESDSNKIETEEDKTKNNENTIFCSKIIQSNENKQNEENTLLNKKTKRPTVGCLTLPSDVKKHYGIDTTGVKRRVCNNNEKKYKKNNKISKINKKTNNKKNEKQ